MAFCILTAPGQKELKPEGDHAPAHERVCRNRLLKKDVSDGTRLCPVGNVKERHIILINKLGLVDSYVSISEVQLE